MGAVGKDILVVFVTRSRLCVWHHPIGWRALFALNSPDVASPKSTFAAAAGLEGWEALWCCACLTAMVRGHRTIGLAREVRRLSGGGMSWTRFPVVVCACRCAHLSGWA